MPKFTLKLTLLLYFWLGDIASRLEKETHFSAHAKVRNCQNGQFAQEGVTTQLNFVLIFLKELFHGDWLYLHDITNI